MSRRRQSSVTHLTKSLKEGRERAWRQFHREYAPRLVAFVHHLTDDLDTVPDILQETLMRVVRHVRGFDEEEVFWCWLACLARSATRDHYRRNVTRQGVMERYEQELRLQETMSDSSPGLQADLQRLPSDLRSLLEKKYFQGYSVKDIAKEQDRSPKRVAHALASARDALRKILKGERTSS